MYFRARAGKWLLRTALGQGKRIYEDSPDTAWTILLIVSTSRQHLASALWIWRLPFNWRVSRSSDMLVSYQISFALNHTIVMPSIQNRTGTILAVRNHTIVIPDI